jgi:hypothetical protein
LVTSSNPSIILEYIILEFVGLNSLKRQLRNKLYALRETKKVLPIKPEEWWICEKD